MVKKFNRQARQPIFVACEGKSELGYVAWLRRMAEIQDVPVSLIGRDMRGGGPKKIAYEAARFLLRSAGGPTIYHRKYLLMDRGAGAKFKQEFNDAEQIAKKNSFSIIWQHLCHECFLMKHFARTERLNPSTADDCNRALLGVWPDYRKGMDATDYERQLSLDHLARGRSNLPDLDAFLNDIGWN